MMSYSSYSNEESTQLAPTLSYGTELSWKLITRGKAVQLASTLYLRGPAPA